MSSDDQHPELGDELLQQAARGDDRAYEELFGRYREQLHRLIEHRLTGRVRQRIDVSDVVQETYLETAQRLPDFLARRPMPFSIWLKQSARQQVARFRRIHATATKRSVDREQGLPDRSSELLAASLADPKGTPSEAAAREEYRCAVMTAVERLSEGDRDMLLMRHLEETPFREISQILEIDEAAARKRYGRALLRLRQQLASLGVQEELDG